jgi:(p)ppGpp synthase/HD superfamily hydrolase
MGDSMEQFVDYLSESGKAHLFLETFGILQAAETAKKYHAGQLRKYTNEPYIVHVWGVAGLVYSVSEDISMVQAALLHDTVEDTDLTLQNIEEQFGETVATLVRWLTDISKPEDGNRKVRKNIDREHIAAAPAEAQTIKLADLIDNTKTIALLDPDFARVYMKEKRELLEVLIKGDVGLHAIAVKLCDWYDKSQK